MTETSSTIEAFRPASGESIDAQTQSPSLSAMTEQAGYLHNRVKILYEDTSVLHGDILATEWTQRTSDLVRRDLRTLLEQLANLGFAWREIATLVGVSVPAIQKWRQGAPARGESRTDTAAVLAAAELIQEHYCVADVASWFGSPVIPGVPVTPLTIYAAGHVDKVFLLASGNAQPEEVLDSIDRDWRDHYRDNFETFRANDGHLSLRERPS